MPGFAPSQPVTSTRRVWFSLYASDNEDHPLAINRVQIEQQHGQDLAQLAVLHARHILRTQPEVFEVIAHAGPYDVPRAGEDVLARVCREPFRYSTRLG